MDTAVDDDSWCYDESPLPLWLEGDSLAPPCQSGDDVVAAILSLACVGPADVVYDLGCGDGRICIAAAEQHHARGAVGIEIEPELCRLFEGKIAAKQLADKVRCVEGDLEAVSLEDATVLVLYLLPAGIAGLEEKLRQCLLRGARVVCNTWGLPKSYAPASRVDLGDAGSTMLLLYTKNSVPTAAAAVGGADGDDNDVLQQTPVAEQYT
eukprot:SAG11_NODE_295_length_11115_cov_14.005264_1_plen_209_part_00